mgnify:CR=1 FL=1
MTDPSKLLVVIDYLIWSVSVVIWLWAMLNGKFRFVSLRHRYEQLAYDELDDMLLGDPPSPGRYMGRQLGVALVILVVGFGVVWVMASRAGLGHRDLAAAIETLFDTDDAAYGPR